MWQESRKDKTDLIIGEVLRNLAILYMLDPTSIIPPWNAKVDNYVVLIFELAKKYMARNGFIFLFHDDDFNVLRDIKSYLDNYGFIIHSK